MADNKEEAPEEDSDSEEEKVCEVTHAAATEGRWTPPCRLKKEFAKNGWECGWCLYKNPGHTLECVACTAMPTPNMWEPVEERKEEMQKMKDNGWFCARCGNMNMNKAGVTCGVCSGVGLRAMDMTKIPKTLQGNPIALFAQVMRRQDVKASTPIDKNVIRQLWKAFDPSLTEGDICKAMHSVGACTKATSGQTPLEKVFAGLILVANRDTGNPKMRAAVRRLFWRIMHPPGHQKATVEATIKRLEEEYGEVFGEHDSEQLMDQPLSSDEEGDDEGLEDDDEKEPATAAPGLKRQATAEEQAKIAAMKSKLENKERIKSVKAVIKVLNGPDSKEKTELMDLFQSPVEEMKDKSKDELKAYFVKTLQTVHFGEKEELEAIFDKAWVDNWTELPPEDNPFMNAMGKIAAQKPKIAGRLMLEFFLLRLRQLSIVIRGKMVERASKLAKKFAKKGKFDVKEVVQSRQDDFLRREEWAREIKAARETVAKMEKDSGGKLNTPLKYVDGWGGKAQASGEYAGRVGGGKAETKWTTVSDLVEGAVPVKDFKKKLSVARKKGFEPDEVQQGELGDCWFLSSLSCMATFPSYVDNLVLTKNYMSCGMYKIRFCMNGIWQTITIDDRFPSRGPYLVNAQLTESPDKKKRLLWGPLVEKAYAKLYGDYETIEAGYVSEALTDLTGAPTETYNTRNEHLCKTFLFHKIFSSWKSNYLMGAGSLADLDEKATGLVQGHAYSIMQAALLKGKGKDGTDLRLLKLRNPWGTGEWNGAYSDKSPEMKNPELSAALNHTDTDDGQFWIEYSDFLDYFDTVTVCMAVPTWQHIYSPSYFAAGSELPAEAYLVSTKTPTRAMITWIQPSDRGQPEDYSFTDIGFVILEVDAANPKDCSQYEFKDMLWPSISRTKTITTKLTADIRKGRATLILPFQFNATKGKVQFTTTIYAANPVVMRRIVPYMDSLRMGIHLAIEENRKDKKMKVKKFQGKNGPVGVEYISYSVGDAIYCLVNNTHDKWAFQFNMDCSKSRGLRSERGATKTEDVVPPGHRQLVNLVVAEGYGGYSWGVGFSFGFKRKPVPEEKKHNPKITSALFQPLANSNKSLQKEMEKVAQQEEKMKIIMGDEE